MLNPKFAFIDVDGTLIRPKNMFSFHDFWYDQWLSRRAAPAHHEATEISAILKGLERSGASRETINRRYYEFFAGRNLDEVAAAAAEWYSQAKNTPGFLIDETVREISRLRADGYEPVLVSGSFQEILRPLAADLKIAHVLATRLVTNGTKCTGKIFAPQTIGSGKARAVNDFLKMQGGRADSCWAFGDDISDLPMLEAVGHRVAVGSNADLMRIAKARGWRHIVVAHAESDAALAA